MGLLRVSLVSGFVEVAQEPKSAECAPVPAGRGVNLLLLTLAMAAGGYVRTTVSPLQEAIRIALALTDNQMALLQGPALGVPMAIAAIPLGLVIDRHSRVRLLFVLTVLNLVATVLTALAPTFFLLFAARCLVGLAGYATVPIVLSLLADLYPPTHRGRVTMTVSVGQLGGVSAAFALGGMLLAISSSGAGGWRWAMVWLTAPLIPVALLVLTMREPPHATLAAEKASLRHTWPDLWSYRAVIVPVFVGVVIVETAVGAVLTWAAPTLSRSFALPPDRIGAIMAVGLLVSGIFGPIAGGTLADLCQRAGGARRTMLVLSVLAALSIPTGLFAVIPGVVPASVLLVMVMTIMLATAVMGMTLFTIVVPGDLRGLCMSVLVGANILFAMGLAPVMVSLLSSALGGLAMIGNALTVVCVTTGLLAAVVFAFGSRYFPARRSSEPSELGERMATPRNHTTE
jgi:MFS family permease